MQTLLHSKSLIFECLLNTNQSIPQSDAENEIFYQPLIFNLSNQFSADWARHNQPYLITSIKETPNNHKNSKICRQHLQTFNVFISLPTHVGPHLIHFNAPKAGGETTLKGLVWSGFEYSILENERTSSLTYHKTGSVTLARAGALGAIGCMSF